MGYLGRIKLTSSGLLAKLVNYYTIPGTKIISKLVFPPSIPTHI